MDFRGISTKVPELSRSVMESASQIGCVYKNFTNAERESDGCRFEPKYRAHTNNGPAGRPRASLPSRSLLNFCAALRRLAVQSCGGMPNLLLPPGHIMREAIHGLRG